MARILDDDTGWQNGEMIFFICQSLEASRLKWQPGMKLAIHWVKRKEIARKLFFRQ